MQHHTAIAQRPAPRSLRRLLTHETVFDDEPVVAERLLVEQVTELPIEGPITTVVHADDAIYDLERIRVVVAWRMPRDLRGPSGQIASIEERNPILVIRPCITRIEPPQQRNQH